MTSRSLLGRIKLPTDYKKEKIVPFVALLFFELFFAGYYAGNRTYFWLIVFAFGSSMALLLLFWFRVHYLKFRHSKWRNDIIFLWILGFTFIFNTLIFNNIYFLFIVCLVFVLFFGYLMLILKHGINQSQRNALLLGGIFSLFFFTNAVLNIAIIFQGESSSGLLKVLLAFVFFAATSLNAIYLFKKYNLAGNWVNDYGIVLGLVVSEIFLVGSFFIQKYPSFYELNINFAFSSLPILMVVCFYSLFGLMAYRISNKLNTKIVVEYATVSAIIILTLFATTEWFIG